MSAALQLTSLADMKESALAEFDTMVKKTWEDFGVRPEHLSFEIQTWYWHIVWKGNKAYEELRWKGIGETIGRYIERKRMAILEATDENFRGVVRKARDGIHLAACYLWSKELIQGPASSLRLINQASKAESLANYLEKLGKDTNAEKQREKAAILRRIAAGEELELPKRASGAIDKIRELFAKLDSDGLPHIRKEYIDAGIAAGIHPGTCAVQYARWKREHK